MLHDRIEIFVDRLEARMLFRQFCGRDPQKPWPLLPILTFLAPAGGGKSELMNYLCRKECCLPNGSAALPYAYFDFADVDTSKDLLSLLVSLRNQLQSQRDGQGRNLHFPRFDLGASIALAVSADGKLPLMSKPDVQQKLAEGVPLLGPLGEMGNALSNVVPIIAPLLVGLRWAGQIKPMKMLIQRIESGPGWRWYREQGLLVDLPADASVSAVILRLQILSMPGRSRKHGRDHLIERVLPAAFFADLREALDHRHAPKAWSRTANVVLFLDSFDALLHGSGENTMGIRLLEMLALSEHRKRGETDPLLIVVGSRQRLLQYTSFKQDVSFEQKTDIQDLSGQWHQHLPTSEKRQFLRLSDLYLPLWLHDFGVDDTHRYLSELDKHGQPLFDSPLVQALHQATHGHPLYLALAATAMREARVRQHAFDLEALEQLQVPARVVPYYEDQRIGDYLLDLYFSHLSPAEQLALVFCAVPRALTARTLRVVLQLSSDIEARECWSHYRHMTFAYTADNEKIIFHPVIHHLLRQRLPPDPFVESDYYLVHQRLRDHFRRHDNPQEKIEEAYHALALGDHEPAVELAVFALDHDFSLWEALLEAVAQAPKALIPSHAEQLATDTLDRAKRDQRLRDSVTAIILHKWLSIDAVTEIQNTTADARTPTSQQEGTTL